MELAALRQMKGDLVPHRIEIALHSSVTTMLQIAILGLSLSVLMLLNIVE